MPVTITQYAEKLNACFPDIKIDPISAINGEPYIAIMPYDYNEFILPVADTPFFYLDIPKMSEDENFNHLLPPGEFVKKYWENNLEVILKKDNKNIPRFFIDRYNNKFILGLKNRLKCGINDVWDSTTKEMPDEFYKYIFCISNPDDPGNDKWGRLEINDIYKEYNTGIEDNRVTKWNFRSDKRHKKNSLYEQFKYYASQNYTYYYYGKILSGFADRQNQLQLRIKFKDFYVKNKNKKNRILESVNGSTFLYKKNNDDKELYDSIKNIKDQLDLFKRQKYLNKVKKHRLKEAIFKSFGICIVDKKLNGEIKKVKNEIDEIRKNIQNNTEILNKKLLSCHKELFNLLCHKLRNAINKSFKEKGVGRIIYNISIEELFFCCYYVLGYNDYLKYLNEKNYRGLCRNMLSTLFTYNFNRIKKLTKSVDHTVYKIFENYTQSEEKRAKEYELLPKQQKVRLRDTSIYLKLLDDKLEEKPDYYPKEFFNIIHNFTSEVNNWPHTVIKRGSFDQIYDPDQMMNLKNAVRGLYNKCSKSEKIELEKYCGVDDNKFIVKDIKRLISTIDKLYSKYEKSFKANRLKTVKNLIDIYNEQPVQSHQPPDDDDEEERNNIPCEKYNPADFINNDNKELKNYTYDLLQEKIKEIYIKIFEGEENLNFRNSLNKVKPENLLRYLIPYKKKKLQSETIKKTIIYYLYAETIIGELNINEFKNNMRKILIETNSIIDNIIIDTLREKEVDCSDDEKNKLVGLLKNGNFRKYIDEMDEVINNEKKQK